MSLMKNLKLAAVAGAVAMAFATPSHALVQTNNATTGSSLFLTAWVDGVVSYARDLGATLSSVLNLGTPGNVNSSTSPNAAWVSEAGANFSFAGDALFASTFTGQSLSNIEWNIVAADSVGGSAATPAQLVATFATDPAAGLTGTATTTAATRVSQMITALGSIGCGISCATSNPGSPAFGGNDATWEDNLAGSLGARDTTTLGNGPMDFWFIRQNGGASSASAYFKFANSQFDGEWRLFGDGTAQYTLQAASVAEVPVPGAIWLLASGLMGFAAVSRRRKLAQA